MNLFTFQQGHAILTSMEYAIATNATTQEKEAIAELFEVQAGLIIRNPNDQANADKPYNQEAHDNWIAYVCSSPKKARAAIYYGLFHFFCYVTKPCSLIEKLRYVRQPYQIAIALLNGFRICDPIS